MIFTRPPSFDLTRSLRRTQGNDPCWFLETAPASFDIIGHIQRVIERGDVRKRFAMIVGGKCG